MILFYTSEINNNQASLEEEEFVHCCKVLRHSTGDEIQITDGNGTFAKAKIVQLHKRNALLEVLEQQKIKPHSTIIELIIAPPKTKSRWEWLLEKSVEVGVDIISPVITDNIERKKINLERNKKIIRSAALQSKRIIHPTINDIVTLKDYMDDEKVKHADKYLCHYKADNVYLNKCSSTNKNVVIIVGPEGDFSPNELDYLKRQNCQCVNISENRLRTETAAIIAVSQATTIVSK